jgi:hypothetical protein
MELSKKIFGKELYQITRVDLEEYFSVPREETSLLEFKSGEIKINSIFKEICAFLNTEGGVIVIGSPKEQKVQKPGKRMRRICKGELEPSEFRSKKWLYGLISTNIVPFPKGIEIHQIPADEGNYFIIEVPQSYNPPHQFLTDGRYYIRIDKEAKPAPHGIVEALFYKKQKAQLRVDLQIDRAENGAETFNNIGVNIRNISQFPADQVSYLIQLFNIEEIHSDGVPADSKISEKEDGYEIEGQCRQVLVDDRSLEIRFKIMNRLQPYLISVLAWNKQAGMFKFYSLFDPMNFHYIDTYKTGDYEEKSLETMYKTLSEIKLQLD